MTFVNWYVDEERYVSLDDILERTAEECNLGMNEDPSDDEIAAYITKHGLEPAKCNQCSRTLPVDARYPLCRGCQQTLEGYAKTLGSPENMR